jgi:hypothetical protein
VVVAISRHRLCFEKWLHNTLHWECLLLLFLFLMWYDSVLNIYLLYLQFLYDNILIIHK